MPGNLCWGRIRGQYSPMSRAFVKEDAGGPEQRSYLPPRSGPGYGAAAAAAGPGVRAPAGAAAGRGRRHGPRDRPQDPDEGARDAAAGPPAGQCGLSLSRGQCGGAPRSDLFDGGGGGVRRRDPVSRVSVRAPAHAARPGGTGANCDRAREIGAIRSVALSRAGLAGRRAGDNDRSGVRGNRGPHRPAVDRHVRARRVRPRRRVDDLRKSRGGDRASHLQIAGNRGLVRQQCERVLPLLRAVADARIYRHRPTPRLVMKTLLSLALVVLLHTAAQSQGTPTAQRPVPGGAIPAWMVQLQGTIAWQQVTPAGVLLVSTDRELAGIDIDLGKAACEKPELGGRPPDSVRMVEGSLLMEAARPRLLLVLDPVTGVTVFGSRQLNLAQVVTRRALPQSGTLLVHGRRTSGPALVPVADLQTGC